MQAEEADSEGRGCGEGGGGTASTRVADGVAVEAEDNERGAASEGAEEVVAGDGWR
jgi:hypothetical protein